MHFSVNKEHRDFFRKNHRIECEGVLSHEEVNKASQGVTPALESRLQIKKGSALAQLSSDFAFSAGRDLWREEVSLKKIALNRSLAEIAGEWMEQRPVRFGYDMLFPSFPLNKNVDSGYEKLVAMKPTLMEMSGIQGVLCGAMVCLSGSTSDELPDSELFSKTPGSAVFFSPDFPLPMEDIKLRVGFNYLMIVYAKAKAVYVRQ